MQFQNLFFRLETMIIYSIFNTLYQRNEKDIREYLLNIFLKSIMHHLSFTKLLKIKKILLGINLLYTELNSRKRFIFNNNNSWFMIRTTTQFIFRQILVRKLS